MRIAISHTTRYRFDTPARYGVQRLRMRPRDCAVQSVLDWQLTVEGAVIEAAYDDHNGNATTLISWAMMWRRWSSPPMPASRCAMRQGLWGRMRASCRCGISPTHALTKPGPKMRELASRFTLGAGADLEVLHELSHAVHGAVAYEKGHTDAATTGEQALELGRGVCQDHAHVFIGAARLLGVPARYVSGYLMMDTGTAQDAGHAWAEAMCRALAGWASIPRTRSAPTAAMSASPSASIMPRPRPSPACPRAGATGLSVALDVAQQLMAQ
jgi:transglutaminase-like putative cysteine protease